MRVFVGYGYLPHEAWVEEFVLPLLEQLGLHVVTGKEIPGEPIDETIHSRIEQCDAVLGMLLRRGGRPNRDGTWQTSEYVQEELQIGIGHDKHVTAVVEEGVRPPGGSLKQRQHLVYQAKQRDRFLVALTRHLREWIQGEVKIRLAPEALVRELGPSVYARAATCSYRIVHGSLTEREGKAEIFPEGGGMFVKLLGFRPGTHAQLEVSTGVAKWYSALTLYSEPFADLKVDAQIVPLAHAPRA